VTNAASPAPNPESLTLVVRRTVHASPQRLFSAWTDPAHLERWWGPAPVRCAGAEVDLRIGGAYRIANRLPSGDVLWIVGTFERIEPPRVLVYSWRLEPGPDTRERVTVRFEPRGEHTEVIVLHERIAGEAIRVDHERGWMGCLDGLVAWAEGREWPPRDHGRTP
jgi:uncharacterized protein YndB with AHSA1/START domain